LTVALIAEVSSMLRMTLLNPPGSAWARIVAIRRPGPSGRVVTLIGGRLSQEGAADDSV
jgi:hypothetical protein